MGEGCALWPLSSSGCDSSLEAGGLLLLIIITATTTTTVVRDLAAYIDYIFVVKMRGNV